MADFKEAENINLDKSAPSTFLRVDKAPTVAVFKLSSDCNADTNPKKVNLGVGAFRTEEGKPWVLPVVTEVERKIAIDTSLNKEYLPIAGLKSFRDQVMKFALGETHPVLLEGRAVGVQAISGTGALRLGADFLRKYHANFEKTPVFVSSPTWPNHVGIFKTAGFTDIRTYRYWNAEDKNLDFDNMIKDFENAPMRSIMIFHCCAHNPTGCDPTRDQWLKIAKVLAEKQAFPIFDTAYQGFASGDPAADAWPLRLFAAAGFEMFVVSSFSKNFGLYNERVGQLTAVSKDKALLPAVQSQLEILIRTNYSNPPVHGALLVATILKSSEYQRQWLDQLNVMSNRILEMRQLLRNSLEQAGCPGKWSHITSQIGMFSYTGLSEKQCDWLKNERSLYLMKSGRINMCAITKKNVDYVAISIRESFEHA